MKLINVFETESLVYDISHFLLAEDLSNLSKTNSFFQKQIYKNSLVWQEKISQYFHFIVPNHFFIQLQKLCRENKIEIDYRLFFINLYHHRHYLIQYPLSHFKLLYPFIFKDNFSKATTTLFVLRDTEVAQEKHRRNILDIAYLIKNEALIKQLGENKEIKNRLSKSKSEDAEYNKIKFAIKSDNIEILLTTLKKLNKEISVIVKGDNLLHLAIRHESVNIIKFLLAHHPELTKQHNENEVLPLLLAFAYCSLDTIQLFRGTDSEETFQEKIAQLQSKKGYPATDFALLNKKHRAVVFDYLVETQKFDLTFKFEGKYNLVHRAALNSLDVLLFLEKYFEEKNFYPGQKKGDGKFKELANKLIDSKHIVQVLIEEKFEHFLWIKDRINYLKNLCNLDLTTLGAPNNTLFKIATQKLDPHGIDYCVSVLKQSVPYYVLEYFHKESLGAFTISENSSFFAQLKSDTERAKKAQVIMEILMQRRKEKIKYEEKQEVCKKFQIKFESEDSNLKKVCTILKKYYKSLGYFSDTRKKVGSLLDNLKSIDNANASNETIKDIILQYLPNLPTSTEPKANAVWNCILDVLYSNQNTVEKKSYCKK